MAVTKKNQPTRLDRFSNSIQNAVDPVKQQKERMPDTTDVQTENAGQQQAKIVETELHIPLEQETASNDSDNAKSQTGGVNVVVPVYSPSPRDKKVVKRRQKIAIIDSQVAIISKEPGVQRSIYISAEADRYIKEQSKLINANYSVVVNAIIQKVIRESEENVNRPDDN